MWAPVATSERVGANVSECMRYFDLQPCTTYAEICWERSCRANWKVVVKEWISQLVDATFTRNL